MTETLVALAAWLGCHSVAAYVGVFVLSALESLVVIGLIVPGATIMFMLGALLATGPLGFWPIMVSAVLGAVVGDGVSYWVGRRYRHRIRDVWPFRQRPVWLTRSEDFFRRHGAKSVVLGRFIGPVRPVLPAVVGMLEMPPARFFLVDVLAAILWAPAYLLPGMAFGASLALAGQVATRLAVLLCTAVGFLWLTVALIRWGYRHLLSRSEYLVDRTMRWSTKHRVLGRVPLGLLDPEEPQAPALLRIAAVFLAATWGGLMLLENGLAGAPLVRIDQSFYYLMTGLRTPWGDWVMVALAGVGDAGVLVPVVGGVLGVLLLRRNWRAAAYWLAAIGFGLLSAAMLELSLPAPRPAVTYPYASTHGFTIGHATLSMAAYGFLAVLTALNLSAARRWIPFALAGLLVGATSLSRLYLGAHRLSDTAVGLVLGLVWTAVLGVAYRRHLCRGGSTSGLLGTALLVLAVSSVWHIGRSHAGHLDRYSARYSVRRIEELAWWETEWKTFPPFRLDLGGEIDQPVNVQFAGDIETLRKHLEGRGWRRPVRLTAMSAMQWLEPTAALADRPILPKVYEGRHESLLLVCPLPARGGGGDSESVNDRQLVLRLWPADAVLSGSEKPLWVGTVSFQAPRLLLILTVPKTQRDFDSPLAALSVGVDGLPCRRVSHALPAGQRPIHWDGEVLLVRDTAAEGAAP